MKTPSRFFFLRDDDAAAGFKIDTCQHPPNRVRLTHSFNPTHRGIKGRAGHTAIAMLNDALLPQGESSSSSARRHQQQQEDDIGEPDAADVSRDTLLAAAGLLPDTVESKV